MNAKPQVASSPQPPASGESRPPVDKTRWLPLLPATEDWQWEQPGLSDALASSQRASSKKKAFSVSPARSTSKPRRRLGSNESDRRPSASLLNVRDDSDDDARPSRWESDSRGSSRRTSQSLSVFSSQGRRTSGGSQTSSENSSISDQILDDSSAIFSSPESTDFPLPSSSAPTYAPSSDRARMLSNSAHPQNSQSMVELHSLPPHYPSPSSPVSSAVCPRDEEGQEGLPPYTCGIHLEGWMARKIEQSAPGVPARDRSWHLVYVQIRGTSLKVFSRDLRTHPMEGEEDWSVVPPSIAGSTETEQLHFHPGEYGNPAPGLPIWFADARSKAVSKLARRGPAPSNVLLRALSLQHAQSGIAKDYFQRPHVVRIRAEGEQFLLQVRDDKSVLDLIETIQAATNVALDLDARPLPVFLTLPRRLRRRAPTPERAPIDSVGHREQSPGRPIGPAI